MQTATFIRAILKEKKLTQIQAAEIAGIHPATFKKRLYYNNFTIIELLEICRSLGYNLCVTDAEGNILHKMTERRA